jgi:hypothetical protein
MSSVIFILNVYEIEGKNNVGIYINNLKKQLDAINVKYKFKDSGVGPVNNGDESESFNKIKNMDKSIIDKFLDFASVSNNMEKNKQNIGINSIELEIYDETLFNINSLGVHQLNNWIRQKENKEEHVPLL